MPQEIIDRVNVTLTDVPADLHRSWKAMAALNDLSMKDALLEALKCWISIKSKEMEIKLQADHPLLIVPAEEVPSEKI